MLSAEQYLQKAMECERLAEVVANDGLRVLYRRLAAQWYLLAEQADFLAISDRPLELDDLYRS